VASAEQTDVVVSLDVGVTLADAETRLRAAGLVVTRTLEEIGVVCGSVARSRLPALAEVPGIAAVEEARSVRLPPPDAPVQ
jgi:hypothetical protein